MTEVPELPELGRRVAAAKALTDALSTMDREVRQTMSRIAVEHGIRKLELSITGDDGTPYGTVSMTAGRVYAKVVDRERFTGWVRRRYPTEIVQVASVNPPFERMLLEQATKRGDPVDPQGELMPGVEVDYTQPGWRACTTAEATAAARSALHDRRWRGLLPPLPAAVRGCGNERCGGDGGPCPDCGLDVRELADLVEFPPAGRDTAGPAG